MTQSDTRTSLEASADGDVSRPELGEGRRADAIPLATDNRFVRGVGPMRAKAFAKLLKALYKLFLDCDCSMVEINPLVVTPDGEVLALDAKFDFDSNALYRHPDIEALRDPSEEDPREVERILLNVARKDSRVAQDPAPVVRFNSFGDSALDFSLRIWTNDLGERWGMVSDMRTEIFEAFKKADVAEMEKSFAKEILFLGEHKLIDLKEPMEEPAIVTKKKMAESYTKLFETIGKKKWSKK